MSKAKAQEQFENEVLELSNKEIIVCGKYINARTKIKFKHIICNNEFETTPDSFSRKPNCPLCSKKERMKKEAIFNGEKFKFNMKEIFNDDYTVIGKYINGRTKIKVRHNICNKEFNIIPQNTLSEKKIKCEYCKNKENAAIFIKKVFDFTIGEYEVLGEYINMDTKVLMKHLLCNHKWETKPHWFINRGKRCPKCFGNPKKDTEFFKREVYNLVGNEYLVNGEYVHSESEIDMYHSDCDRYFKVTPRRFLHCSSRCPYCNDPLSKGERRIFNFLEKIGIEFENEFSFDVDGMRLFRFDFAIKDDRNIKCLIEFDGKQHFEPVNIFGGERNFINVSKRDQIKNEYCKNNNIPLLRIPYWEFDKIERNLEDFLMQFNLI